MEEFKTKSDGKKLPQKQFILLGCDIVLIIASFYLAPVLRFGAFLDLSVIFDWPDGYEDGEGVLDQGDALEVVVPHGPVGIVDVPSEVEPLDGAPAYQPELEGHSSIRRQPDYHRDLGGLNSKIKTAIKRAYCFKSFEYLSTAIFTSRRKDHHAVTHSYVKRT